MPIEYEIDEGRRLIQTRCYRDVPLEEVLAHFGVLERDPGCPDHLDVLLDLTEMKTLPEVDEIRAVTERIGTVRPRVSFGTCAIVATHDVIFGMSRMFEVFAERYFEDMRVFRTMREAQDWLAARCQTSPPSTGAGPGA